MILYICSMFIKEGEGSLEISLKFLISKKKKVNKIKWIKDNDKM